MREQDGITLVEFREWVRYKYPDLVLPMFSDGDQHYDYTLNTDFVAVIKFPKNHEIYGYMELQTYIRDNEHLHEFWLL